MKNRIARSPAKMLRYGFIALCCAVLLAACGNNMRDDSRLKPYEVSPVFSDGTSARPIDPNTVARSQSADLALTTGKQNGTIVAAFPVTVDRDTIAKGQLTYNIYCQPCHGAAADGRGTVSGYFNPKPANLLTDTLRLQPVGHFFDVITNGKGAMLPYSSRVAPADRWAIIAYIRALQINKEAPLEVPADQVQSSGGGVQ
ncbi:MAG TPA: cytochrome c [Roseiflexaceae bacterium]|nr:cytochrome c [Roseiflexaceae bacterium]